MSHYYFFCNELDPPLRVNTYPERIYYPIRVIKNPSYWIVNVLHRQLSVWIQATCTARNKVTLTATLYNPTIPPYPSPGTLPFLTTQSVMKMYEELRGFYPDVITKDTFFIMFENDAHYKWLCEEINMEVNTPWFCSDLEYLVINTLSRSKWPFLLSLAHFVEQFCTKVNSEKDRKIWYVLRDSIYCWTWSLFQYECEWINANTKLNVMKDLRGEDAYIAKFKRNTELWNNNVNIRLGCLVHMTKAIDSIKKRLQTLDIQPFASPKVPLHNQLRPALLQLPSLFSTGTVRDPMREYLDLLTPQQRIALLRPLPLPYTDTRLEDEYDMKD